MSRRADDNPPQGLSRAGAPLEQMTPEQLALLRGDVNGERLAAAPNPQVLNANQVQQSARENNGQESGGNAPAR